MDPQMVDPLLKDTHTLHVHQIQIDQTGWPHLRAINSGISLCSNVTVSRARCDFTDVNITSLGKGCMWHNVVKLQVLLTFTCKVAHQKLWRCAHICKRYCEKTSGTFLFRRCIWINITIIHIHHFSLFHALMTDLITQIMMLFNWQFASLCGENYSSTVVS